MEEWNVQERSAQEKKTREYEMQESILRKNDILGRTPGREKIRNLEIPGQESFQGQKTPEPEEIWEKAASLEPDPCKKRASVRLIQSGIDAKKIRHMPSPGELLWIQVQYIPPVFWALQGGLLCLLILRLYRMPGQGMELADYLWWSSIGAAWMGVLSNGLLGKHFFNRMAELEQSCYINLSQMWMIRMILATGTDIGILILFSGGIAARTDTFFGRISMYLLVPFLLSNVCCLLFVGALRGGRGKYSLVALAVITTLLAVSPAVFVQAYAAAYLWVWFCLLVLGGALFAGQVRYCYKRMTRGEMICWN